MSLGSGNQHIESYPEEHNSQERGLTILSAPIVSLVGPDTPGKHGTSVNAGSVLGQIGFIEISVIVRVDKHATLDIVASGQTAHGVSRQGVGHVRIVLNGGTDSLASPVAVWSDEGVVGKRLLVLARADGVGIRVRGGRAGSRRSGRGGGRGRHG